METGRNLEISWSEVAAPAGILAVATGVVWYFFVFKYVYKETGVRVSPREATAFAARWFFGGLVVASLFLAFDAFIFPDFWGDDASFFLKRAPLLPFLGVLLSAVVFASRLIEKHRRFPAIEPEFERFYYPFAQELNRWFKTFSAACCYLIPSLILLFLAAAIYPTIYPAIYPSSERSALTSSSLFSALCAVMFVGYSFVSARLAISERRLKKMLKNLKNDADAETPVPPRIRALLDARKSAKRKPASVAAVAEILREGGYRYDSLRGVDLSLFSENVRGEAKKPNGR